MTSQGNGAPVLGSSDEGSPPVATNADDAALRAGNSDNKNVNTGLDPEDIRSEADALQMLMDEDWFPRGGQDNPSSTSNIVSRPKGTEGTGTANAK